MHLARAFEQLLRVGRSGTLVEAELDPLLGRDDRADGTPVPSPKAETDQASGRIRFFL